MTIFNNSNRIIVTCSNRLSPYLEMEVKALGYTPVRIFKTGVELMGTMQDCIRLNLNLRCASQVLFSINECRAFNADELYKVLVDYAWENVLPLDGYFSITSNVNNETITNNL
ncbi:MAG: class I SAM-dependent RNA methyltransferase, partial [Ferruginibacter sp.]|nr:class I SAM-dependent RNA methyltransferase [Ferruginibacter sp.]